MPVDTQDIRSSDLLMVVGSLNRAAPRSRPVHGRGISVFRLDEANGSCTLLCEEAGIDNPSFLSIDPLTRTIYANSEVDGWHEGTVSAFRFDAGAQHLRYLNKQPSLGSITAHSSLAPGGHHLLVVNYGTGPEEEGPDRALVVYPLRPDGSLDAPSSSVSHRGQGPNAARQERAHPHGVRPSPDGGFVVVADLGLDALISYRWRGDGSLPSEPDAVTPLPPGAGPRHFAWVPGSPLAVVICELDSTLRPLRFDPASGGFTLLSAVSALPEGFAGENHCSGVTVSADGRFVYGANRGDDSIAVFAIDLGTGALRAVAHQSCGRTPRDIALTPSGRTLAVANQGDDTVDLFAVDPASGALRPKSKLAVGTPMCVAFMATRPRK